MEHIYVNIFLIKGCKRGKCDVYPLAGSSDQLKTFLGVALDAFGGDAALGPFQHWELRLKFPSSRCMAGLNFLLKIHRDVQVT